MPRAVYTREFKLRAVALLDEGKTVPQLSKELDVAESNLYAWRTKYKSNPESAFVNEPQFNEQELELRRLRAENLKLKEERDILKKAAAWFAKESEQSTR